MIVELWTWGADSQWKMKAYETVQQWKRRWSSVYTVLKTETRLVQSCKPQPFLFFLIFL
ncbi:hypothetical protein NC651_003004 [Populus alba x Populus x berolinensis]|nr:hypothetical protein NC651_003004 [Populus alba x Populus x berolinensis]